MAAELQEVWEQAEYSALHKENTQCITNVPDTQARFLPAQVEVSEVYFYTNTLQFLCIKCLKGRECNGL